MPRFRTGHRVPLNVYDGDRPIFQAHSIESAAELVRLLNLGLASEGRLDEFRKPSFVNAQEVDEPRGLHCPSCGDDRTPDADGMQTYTCGRCGTLAPPVPDTPPSAPESPSEPPPATGQPADDSGPRDGALSILRRLYRPTEKAPDPNWEWEIEVPPGDHDPGPHWVRVDRHSRSWEYFEPLTPAERAAWEQLS